MEPKRQEISHYGVPGMKWGVRRSEAQLAKAAEKRSKKKSSVKLIDDKTGRSVKIKYDGNKARINERGNLETNSKREAKKIQGQYDRSKPKLMDDDELRGAINRMNMERQYSQLTGLSTTQSGARRVGQLVAKDGTEIIRNAAKQVATEYVKDEMKKMAGLKK